MGAVSLSLVAVPAVVGAAAGASVVVNRYYITDRERTMLLVTVMIVSICALTYELIVATLSSYLLGNSVTQFSLTIGLFLFALGLGSLLSRRIRGNELRWFVIIELAVGVVGGISATILYAVYTVSNLYYLTMIVLILLIGGLSGLEIPLLTRIVAHRDELSHALADVLSVDYLGALLASLAFPLVLLPTFGVTVTAFLTGLLNVGVAGLNMYQFRNRISAPWLRPLQVVLAGAMVAMLAGAWFSPQTVDFFERRLYRSPIIYTQQTSYQRIIITRRGEDDIRLFLDGNLQFSTRDEYRYHEILVHPVMNAVRSHERIAVLGGGDGMVVRELLKYEGINEIVVVDLDPVMTELGQTFPLLQEVNQDALNDPRVSIINGDAYTYIAEGTDLFSVIILDLPDPNNEGLSKLYSEQFYRLLKQRLAPDGAFATQATSPYFVREAFWSIVTTIENSGFQAVPLHTYVPSFGEWGFIVAAPHRTPDLGVPTDIPLRYLSPAVLDSAQHFDADISRVPVEVNTLDQPILMRYYEQGWLRWN